MKTPTLWVTTAQLPTYPQLTKDTQADVAIIGGGLTGILTAYLLAKEDKKVVILEKNTIAEGATHLTTAFLTNVLDTDMHTLIETWGLETAKNIVGAHAEAIDLIEEIRRTEDIDCDFSRCSDFIYAYNEDEFGTLLKEYEALNQLGIKASISGDPLPGFKNYGYIEVYHQAKFHPIKFLRGLLNVLRSHNVQIFEKTEARDVKESTLTIITDSRKKIEADWIIATTYEPFKQPLGLFFKKGMYTTYVLEAHIPQDVMREGIYEDTYNPYHYFRVDRAPTFDTLIIGGEDHRSDIPLDPEKNFDALEEYLRNLLEDREYSIANRWDGPILEPSDGLAFIGPHKNPNILYAFGFSGNGMTYAGISARIFQDLISGKEHPLFNIFRTSRVLGPKALISKAIDYGGEFIHGAAKNVFRSKKKVTRKTGGKTTKINY
jgi:glycine/D-amino acid oxidase-like deaminating enzyme